MALSSNLYFSSLYIDENLLGKTMRFVLVFYTDIVEDEFGQASKFFIRAKFVDIPIE